MNLAAFKRVNPDTVVRDLKLILARNRADFANLLLSLVDTPLGWSIFQQLERLEDRLNRFWAPVRHLNAVCETASLRQAYQGCLPLLTDWQAQVDQNAQLYQAINQFIKTDEFVTLQAAQKKLIQNTLRDFHLAGVDLGVAQQAQYRQIKAGLAECAAQFEANILDASAAGALLLTDPSDLNGVPQHVLIAAQAIAHQRGLTGWVIPLEGTYYQAILSTAASRCLRERLYRAWVTRASEQSETQVADNSATLFEILKQRQALSGLLGFKNAAELSLATDKMAPNPQAVIDFLTQLIATTRPKAAEELQTLQDFARTQGQQMPLEAWDIAYWSEKLKAHLFQLDEEQLRPYFPIHQVLKGLFTVLQQLFQIRIEEIKAQILWHPDVKTFAVYGPNQDLHGYFYLDLYARPSKREGAWVDDCQARRLCEDGQLQYPIAFITCNFTPPQSPAPALITHEEVVTLFHEMGHGLHHVLTQINYAGVSGTQGVAWDAVEFPSQFLECFAWAPEVLALISTHYQTGDSLPAAQLQALQASRKFQAALRLLRQLELSLFDFRLHLEFDSNQPFTQIQKLLDHIRHQTSVLTIPAFNRFQQSFSHIFADSYAAGYYSYLWAEVLAADAFGRFQEEGILNAKTGRDFLQIILEQGGAVDALQLFQQFRGRLPDSQAFLKQRGILA